MIPLACQVKHFRQNYIWNETGNELRYDCVTKLPPVSPSPPLHLFLSPSLPGNEVTTFRAS